MSPTSVRVALGVGALALAFCVFPSAPAGAAKPITGKLSKPGYTVFALLTNGRATSARAESGRFRLPTVARKVSLHLRGPDGSYAGPIVVRARRVAGDGRRARAKRGRVILGVKAGAGLGRVQVRRGYARSSRRLPEDSIDRRRTARARNGVPIGARGFGRVRSRPPRKAPADDPDVDGIPDVFDVDDDGDLLLDAQDRGPAKRSSQVSPKGQVSPEDEMFGLFTRLELGLPFTVNANPRSAADPQQPAFDDAEIEAALPRSGHFGMSILPGQDPELDCGGAIQNPPRPEGLIYCRPHSAGGTGEIPPFNPGTPGFTGANRPFPDCCDSGVPGDPDGNGSLTATGSPVQGAPVGVMQLYHRATPDQIRPGDVLMQTVTRHGTEIGFLSTLQVIFSTVPALASYTDALDDSGAGATHQVSYPVAPSAPPFQVRDSAADPDEDIEVKLQYWRPQRRAEPVWGERAGDWIDVGQMGYVVQVGFGGDRCPADAYTPGPDLSGGPGEPDDPTTSGFSDLSDDRVADPRNTFTFTLNLTRCFTANGIPFSPGDRRSITLVATTIIGSNELGEPLPVAGGVASQSITFEAQEPAPGP